MISFNFCVVKTNRCKMRKGKICRVFSFLKLKGSWSKMFENDCFRTVPYSNASKAKRAGGTDIFSVMWKLKCSQTL